MKADANVEILDAVSLLVCSPYASWDKHKPGDVTALLRVTHAGRDRDNLWFWDPCLEIGDRHSVEAPPPSGALPNS